MRYDAAMREPGGDQRGCSAPCQEFDEVLIRHGRGAPGMPRGRPRSVWTAAGMDPCTMFHETGLFISGGAETTRTVIARGVLTIWTTRTMGTARRRTPVNARRGRGDHPLGHAAEQHVPHRRRVPSAGIPIAPATGWCCSTRRPTATRRCSTTPTASTPLVRPTGRRVRLRPHFCLGASLARLELPRAFEQLTKRLTKLEVLAEPDIEPNIFVGRGAQLGLEPRFAAR